MKKLLFLFIFFPFILMGKSVWPLGEIWAEKNGESAYPNKTLHLSGTQQNKEAQAEKFVIAELQNFFPANTNLHADFFKIGPLGTYISYTQAFFGTSIYGTSVKINIDKNGNVNSIFYKLAETRNWPQKSFPAVADMERIKAETGDFIISNKNNTWFFDGEKAHAAFVAEYGANDGSKHEETVFAANDYSILYTIDKHRYAGGKDSMVRGNVFYPDPLTSSRKTYGAPYADTDDSDKPELNYERVPLEMKVTFEHDSFTLRNEYSQIAEISSPYTKHAFSNAPFFNYSRQDDRFEEVNATYHIYNYRQHVKKIGFDTLGKIPLKVDPHALNGADQSEFDFFQNDLKLLFGDGGIDDAEDADVVIHEYNHFLSFMASGDNGYGSDRLAIEEGLCDYFACSYSKNISNYNWQKVYNWDGNETWNGRSCVTGKNYKTDVSGNRYKDGEIWVGTLMEIQDEIGRDQTDAIMLGTLYFTAKNMTMPTAARIFIHVDSILYGGKNTLKIAQKFIANGLLPDTFMVSVPDKIKNEFAVKINAAYFSSHNIVYAEFDQPQTGIARIFDLQGKELISQDFYNTNKVNIYAPQITQGMYILHISANGIQKSAKLLK
ncbi:MAG: T9SS type A sorting domain-containing protein [Sphingobacteriales bacterium]|nr:MAG: T9SS type A sorting domain-containing protein [Sphingobacteriales bacterium]